MSVKLKFLGASDTVTGSKFLVQGCGKNILVDCGLFQGSRRWREQNWVSPPVEPSSIDAVLLTHAHIDHIGMLPRYYRLGLRCPIYATHSTTALSTLLLPDSARLQEEEAEYRRERHRSRHDPILPLYTEDDARGVLTLFNNVPFGETVEFLPEISAKWRHMGHILGAASIELAIEGRRIIFSGDIGRYSVPVLKDPEPLPQGDLLLIESTYGDRAHTDLDPCQALGEAIAQTARRGGVTVIPSFAVGRAQLLLFYLRELKEKQAIPDLPIIVDSPMASDATAVYQQFSADCDSHVEMLLKSGKQPFAVSKLGFTRDRNDSIRLNSIKEPMVIISASGMISGGRILHHLKHRISDPRNTILFVGHQPEGGRGDWLQKGNKTLHILGEEVPVRAEIRTIGALSAHGDRTDLLRWCQSTQGVPGQTYVVHGEPESAASFAKTLQRELHWNAVAAHYGQEITL